ncbi:MAG: 1-deoxyxylulose-5-phosphate synthase [Clostridia bacterium]|jgi:transketolase|nr:1-deoxyxylulose-5-phosphate synthase [Clostridia bacterium]
MLKPAICEMRKVYVDTLIELAKRDKNIVVLEADLAGAIGTKRFGEIYPNQYINCGIMEANMVGVAAGLSLTGKHSFIHTFSSFAARRAFDQIFMSLAYAGLDAVMLGSDAGITSEHNGGTHMSFEDIGLMRMLPNCIVTEASDEVMLKKLLLKAYEKGGLWYIRTSRKKVPRIYDLDENFEIGTAKVVKDGNDVAILAYGISVADAYEGAMLLETEGIRAAVIDMFSIQPLDFQMILHYADKTGAIVTVENHQIAGGLGSATAEVLAENKKAVKFTRLGIKGRYGQTGTIDYLKKDYGIDKYSIADQVKKLLG